MPAWVITQKGKLMLIAHWTQVFASFPAGGCDPTCPTLEDKPSLCLRYRQVKPSLNITTDATRNVFLLRATMVFTWKFLCLIRIDLPYLKCALWNLFNSNWSHCGVFTVLDILTILDLYRLLHQPWYHHGHVLQPGGAWFAQSTVQEQVDVSDFRICASKPNLCDIQGGQVVSCG